MIALLIIFDTFPKGKTLFQNATEHDKGMQDRTSIDHLKVINYIYKTLEMKYNECLNEQSHFISYLTSIFRFYFGHNLFYPFFRSVGLFDICINSFFILAPSRNKMEIKWSFLLVLLCMCVCSRTCISLDAVFKFI